MSVLQDRDPNLRATSTDGNPENKTEKPNKMAGEEINMKRTLEQRIAELNKSTQSSTQTRLSKPDIQDSKQPGTYISPSDAILSPATQKLAGFKQRQINKQNNKKPTSRSLFSRTASSISAASLEDFEDVNSK